MTQIIRAQLKILSRHSERWGISIAAIPCEKDDIPKAEITDTQTGSSVTVQLRGRIGNTYCIGFERANEAFNQGIWITSWLRNVRKAAQISHSAASKG